METTKIFGQTVRIGSKKHAILVQQKRHFEDLAKYETNELVALNESGSLAPFESMLVQEEIIQRLA